MADGVESYLNELSAILESTVTCYRRLQALTKQEHHAVVVKDVESLSKTARQKEALIGQLRDLEVKRVKVMEKIARDEGVAPHRLSLGDLTAAYQYPVVDRIRKNGAALKATVSRIQGLNRANELLIRHSLEFVRGSMGILKDLMAPPPIYQQNGRVQGDAIGGRMIREQY